PARPAAHAQPSRPRAPALAGGFLMSRRRVRIPMFFKFLAGCLLLAILLIIGGSVVVHLQTTMRRDPNYLARHFKRYLEYQQGLGRALSSVTDLLANEPLLREALATTAPDSGRTATDIAASAFQ